MGSLNSCFLWCLLILLSSPFLSCGSPGPYGRLDGEGHAVSSLINEESAPSQYYELHQLMLQIRTNPLLLLDEQTRTQFTRIIPSSLSGAATRAERWETINGILDSVHGVLRLLKQARMSSAASRLYHAQVSILKAHFSSSLTAVDSRATGGRSRSEDQAHLARVMANIVTLLLEQESQSSPVERAPTLAYFKGWLEKYHGESPFFAAITSPDTLMALADFLHSPSGKERARVIGLFYLMLRNLPLLRADLLSNLLKITSYGFADLVEAPMDELRGRPIRNLLDLLDHILGIDAFSEANLSIDTGIKFWCDSLLPLLAIDNPVALEEKDVRGMVVRLASSMFTLLSSTSADAQENLIDALLSFHWISRYLAVEGARIRVLLHALKTSRLTPDQQVTFQKRGWKFLLKSNNLSSVYHKEFVAFLWSSIIGIPPSAPTAAFLAARKEFCEGMLTFMRLRYPRLATELSDISILITSLWNGMANELYGYAHVDNIFREKFLILLSSGLVPMLHPPTPTQLTPNSPVKPAPIRTGSSSSLGSISEDQEETEDGSSPSSGGSSPTSPHSPSSPNTFGISTLPPRKGRRGPLSGLHHSMATLSIDTKIAPGSGQNGQQSVVPLPDHKVQVSVHTDSEEDRISPPGPSTLGMLSPPNTPRSKGRARSKAISLFPLESIRMQLKGINSQDGLEGTLDGTAGNTSFSSHTQQVRKGIPGGWSPGKRSPLESPTELYTAISEKEGDCCDATKEGSSGITFDPRH